MIKYSVDAEIKTIKLIKEYLINLQNAIKNDDSTDQGLEMHFEDTFQSIENLEVDLIFLDNYIKEI